MSQHEMERQARQALEGLAAEAGVDKQGLPEVVVSRGRQRVQRRRAAGVTAGIAIMGVAGVVAVNQLGPRASLTPMAPTTTSLVSTATSTASPTAPPTTPPDSPVGPGPAPGTAPPSMVGPQPDAIDQLPLGPGFQQEWLAVRGSKGVELHYRGTKVGPDCIGLSLQSSGPTGALVNCTPTGDVIEIVWVKPDGSFTTIARQAQGGAYMSPDGTRAAILTLDPGKASNPYSVVELDPSGKVLRRVSLPQGPGHLELRGWSEAGIWFVEERGMGVVEPSGEVTIVAPDTLGMPLPGTPADMVGVQKRAGGNCLVRAPAGKEPETLRCTEPGRLAYVEVSPTGRYVRFQDDPAQGATGTSAGWIYDLQSGTSYSVPLFGSGGGPRLTGSVTAWEDDHTLVINRAPYDREGPGGDWVRIDMTTGMAERMPPSDTVDLAIQRWG